MAEWYYTDRYSVKIEPVKVICETAQFITVETNWGVRRVQKIGSSWRYFPTQAEAHDYLVGRTKAAIERMERDLVLEEKKLQELGAND